MTVMRQQDERHAETLDFLLAKIWRSMDRVVLNGVMALGGAALALEPVPGTSFRRRSALYIVLNERGLSVICPRASCLNGDTRAIIA